MNRLAKGALTATVALAVVVGLPLAARLMRQPTGLVCALDGAKIDPLYRVEISSEGKSQAFCCVRCAQLWLERAGEQARSIRVTDEASGEPVSAEKAYYVRSEVLTNLATRNRIHVFRNRADAEAHAAKFLGMVLAEQVLPKPPPQ